MSGVHSEILEIQQSMMRSFPVFCQCPYCHKEVPSKVERSISVMNCLCCYCCGGFFLIFNACRNKDPNCYDAIHRCTACDNKLNDYKAC